MKLFLIVLLWALAGITYSDWWSGTFRIASHCFFGSFDEKTDGQIIKSKYWEQLITHGSPSYSIKYRYYVEATVYTSSVVSCETFTRNVRQRLREFPVAREVTVYYDPSFPQFSVLDRDSDISFNVYGQIFLCLIILPLFVFFLAHYVWGIGRVDDENET